MPKRSFAILFIGHPADDDYAAWLRQRLEYARMDLSDLAIVDGHGDAVGTWGGMPCRARHLDVTDLGPLIVTFALEDFEAAVKLPPTDDFELPPPLTAFAEACESLSPHFAALVSDPLDDVDIDHYAAELEADIAEGLPAEVCERPYAALFLSNFNIVMLEEEQPLLTELGSVQVAGGSVFFPAGEPRS
ncbi:hypothetical protein ACWCQQ_26495 [Streptomyces sp. NPDC002143]